jgi:phage gp36-like protein
MSFLTVSELYTHLNQETIDEISRDDESIPQSSIAAAIEEARGYLTAYNTAAIFSAIGDNRNPILLMYVKDIAVWHFINLCNPGIEYQPKLDRYEKAISWLGKVQSGKTNPNFPLPVTPVNDFGNVENFMKWGSNLKRNNGNY